MQMIRLPRQYALVAALLAVVTSLASPARSQSPPDASILGLWGSERTFAQAIAGPVTIVRSGSTLRAFAAGFEADASRAGNDVVFRFPGGRGELRARQPATDRVNAMWTQPATETSGTRYASPARLRSIGPGTWRGTITPKGDRLEIYLLVARMPDGTLAGFFRDPLANIGIFARITGIEQQGDAIRFATGHDPIVGTLDRKAGTISLTLPDFAAPLVFTRRDRLQAAGFYPRTPPAETLTYRRPLLTGDGWSIATPREAGVDSAPLVALVARLASAQTTALRSPYVHSLAVARHGKLVLDEYFAGFGEAAEHDTRSAGKTYADVLAGIARQRGAPISDGTPLLSLYPQYATIANDDRRKRSITVGNALSMSTGLDCDDNDEKSVGNEDSMQTQTQQPDWYKLVLDAKMVRDPGTKAVYCSGSINLAGGAIANATRQWLPLFFDENVAGPLQMQGYALNLTPTGEMYLGGGAYVRPRDFLKVGQLFLDGGVWHGRRLLSRDWVARSWRPRLPLGPGDDYGLAWHIRSYDAGGKTYRAYEAQGNGGQILDAVPQLDLAVMITAGNYHDYRTWGPTRDDVVRRVIGAVVGR
jgi:beta-lactamase family protein